MTIAVVALVALSLSAGCAKPAERSVADQQEKTESAATVTWSMASDCTQCHSDEAQTMSNPECLASKHTQVACTACHSDESGLEAAHKDVSSAKKVVSLKKTQVDPETCLSCHAQDALKEKTAQVTVLTDPNGTTVNPHDLPANDKHATITCLNCHEMHTTDTADTLAPGECLSCHHKEVYECGTCHKV